jgi:hydroxymethylbilane synthase
VGRIDAAVHSLQDVETIRPGGLTIAAVLPRADKRDVLLGAASIRALPQGAVVGTSAPRRAAQLLHARPDCRAVPFRGNVATRLAKLAAGEVHATFLAAAGLQRLGELGAGHPLDAEEWLPAPAQAAIAVECRVGDARTREWLAAIDHAPSRAEVMAERALLAALGGSCHSPVAVLCDLADGALAMRAAIYTPDGGEEVSGEARCAADERPGPGRLAADLLARASPGLRAHFSAPS